MNRFMRGYEFVSNVVAAVLLLILTGLTFVDVVGRNLFNHPLAGATELTEYALVGLVFLIFPLISYHNKHIVIDIFDPIVGPKGRRFQQFLAGILGAVVFAVLAYRLWGQGARLIVYGDVTPYLRIPIAPAYYFMSILSGVATIAFAVSAFRVGKEDETPSDNQSGYE